jgi:hypothetical protein
MGSFIFASRADLPKSSRAPSVSVATTGRPEIASEHVGAARIRLRSESAVVGRRRSGLVLSGSFGQKMNGTAERGVMKSES